ncbi:hypothetical protein [Clostridium sp. JS66]|uniref:hypothetical protein n=1 Tax=Clostridium sp. JS66 TaxID=3064705 RepID=UPI00298DC1AB|nr:hypothetical protein [Clostridium sp. JS66]WPC41211.1 hypothetical protein Q6H37_25480 [Clostridium sp. JS66]
MGNKTKKFELTEKEQKDLFCIAWQFNNFWEDLKEGKKADLACGTCKYFKDCIKSKKSFIYDQFQLMTKLTGVRLNAEIGFRKKVETGKTSFIKSNSSK